MTLQDLGNLGEFVGAIAVVVTLGYLAFQIRQNTVQLRQSSRAIQASVVESNAESGNRVREMLILNTEISDLYLKGLQGYAGLDRRDRLRFGMLLANFTSRVQASYVNNVVLGLDPEGTSGISDVVTYYVHQPGFREWWNRNREAHRPVFRDFVDDRLADVDRGDAT